MSWQGQGITSFLKIHLPIVLYKTFFYVIVFYNFLHILYSISIKIYFLYLNFICILLIILHDDINLNIFN